MLRDLRRMVRKLACFFVLIQRCLRSLSPFKEIPLIDFQELSRKAGRAPFLLPIGMKEGRAGRPKASQSGADDARCCSYPGPVRLSEKPAGRCWVPGKGGGGVGEPESAESLEASLAIWPERLGGRWLSCARRPKAKSLIREGNSGADHRPPLAARRTKASTLGLTAFFHLCKLFLSGISFWHPLISA